MLEADAVDWNRRECGVNCARFAQKTHGLDCRERNGDMADWEELDAHSLRTAVFRIDRIVGGYSE